MPCTSDMNIYMIFFFGGCMLFFLLPIKHEFLNHWFKFTKPSMFTKKYYWNFKVDLQIYLLCQTFWADKKGFLVGPFNNLSVRSVGLTTFQEVCYHTILKFVVHWEYYGDLTLSRILIITDNSAADYLWIVSLLRLCF